ncbi:MAG: HAD family phosphatase [Erysipelotrichia bacterium]|nr:HAD family phosphatase [Erysipelotrichia bacterium]
MNDLKCFKGVIFDMDGLLVDSERFSKHLYREIFNDLNVHFDNNIFKNVLGLSRQAESQYLEELFGSATKVEQFYDLYSKKLYDSYKESKIPLKQGAEQLLFWLKEKEIPFALATSSPLGAVKLAFCNRNISLSDFTSVITADDITKSKPDPQIFLKAADKIHCSIEDCVILEDSYNGIMAAIASGGIPMLVIDLYNPDEEVTKKVKYIKNNLSEVLNLLQETYATN